MGVVKIKLIASQLFFSLVSVAVTVLLVRVVFAAWHVHKVFGSVVSSIDYKILELLQILMATYNCQRLLPTDSKGSKRACCEP